jgi:hypothetical protein
VGAGHFSNDVRWMALTDVFPSDIKIHFGHTHSPAASRNVLKH